MVSARFIGKAAIITGGSGGIGSEIAAAFVSEGAMVAIFDTNAETLQKSVAALEDSGGKVIGEVVDVRNDAEVIAAVNRVAKSFGRVDILVAAAGGSLGTPRDLTEISEADIDLVLDVNVKGTFNCARAVVKHMKVVGGGAIITFSSIGGRGASPVTGVPYAAAKSGILGLTRRLAREVGPDNIRVNAIAPGLFLTGRLQGMFDALSDSERNEVVNAIPLKRMPEINECVQPVLFLASDAASYMTGTVLDVNGGRLMSS
ncbi:MAG: SDR family oxidoreductase [Acidobacteria bacterium]|nr:SDR family oxidoreductase [Acidobacteriota bacterium]